MATVTMTIEEYLMLKDRADAAEANLKRTEEKLDNLLVIREPYEGAMQPGFDVQILAPLLRKFVAAHPEIQAKDRDVAEYLACGGELPWGLKWMIEYTGLNGFQKAIPIVDEEAEDDEAAGC